MKSRFPKRRDPKYLAWIRLQPCFICGDVAEPAHVRSRGAGGDDFANVVPLSHTLHMQLHTVGIRTFERRYKTDLAQVAAAYAEAYTREAHAI